MLGLAYLLVFLVYLAISIGIVVLVVRWAKKRNRRPWVWGSLAAFVMYNIVFWDWIPTVVAHRYYCSTQAGFWVYKTLDQWKTENPGVAEKLVAAQPTIERMPYGDLQILDERFAIETRRKTPIALLSTKIFEASLVDRKTGEVIARGVDVGSGYGELAVGGDSWQVIKFWLKQKPCTTYGIGKLSTEIQNMRGKK